jgi:hypothetical protein
MGKIDVLKKVVTPVKTGVQEIHHKVKTLDSGLRRNDGKRRFGLLVRSSMLNDQ